MADMPDAVEEQELLRLLDDLAERQRAIDALRRKLIAARCGRCQRFGVALRTIRKRHGVTQRSLAHAVGFPHHTKVVKWETSQEFPGAEDLTRVISSLHCRRDEAVILGVAWWCDPLRPRDEI